VTFPVHTASPVPAGVLHLDNQASLGDDGSNGADEDPADNTAQDDTPVLAAFNLQVTKSDGGLSAVPGQFLTYTVAYTNTGPFTATGVVVVETVPLHTTFVAAASAAGWICTPGPTAGAACAFAAGHLPARAGGSLSFVVLVDSPLPAGVTAITNTASVTDDGSHGPEPILADNQATDLAPVQASPDLALGKDDGAIAVLPGGVITYSLTYTNSGNVAAVGVVITETVPVSTTFAAGGPTAWSCPGGSGPGTVCVALVGTVGGGGAGGMVTFRVVVDPTAAPGGQILNTALIGDDGTWGAAPTPADDTDTEPTEIAVPTAVELLYFRAAAGGGSQVVLSWATAVEVDNFGFYLYRAAVDDPAQAAAIHFEPSAFDDGKGDGATYQYTDAPPGAGAWWYWLVDVDTWGRETWHAPVSVTNVGASHDLYLPVIGRR
jgi:uncharacterized repeat protein (TIGR01451 family)